MRARSLRALVRRWLTDRRCTATRRYGADRVRCDLSHHHGGMHEHELNPNTPPSAPEAAYSGRSVFAWPPRLVAAAWWLQDLLDGLSPR